MTSIVAGVSRGVRPSRLALSAMTLVFSGVELAPRLWSAVSSGAGVGTGAGCTPGAARRTGGFRRGAVTSICRSRSGALSVGGADCPAAESGTASDRTTRSPNGDSPKRGHLTARRRSRIEAETTKTQDSRRAWTRHRDHDRPALAYAKVTPAGHRLGTPRPMRSRMTTTGGRFPGSRVVAFGHLPRDGSVPSGMYGRRLTAYSCGGSCGIAYPELEYRSLNTGACAPHSLGYPLRVPPSIMLASRSV
jgi:hypothetical protein